MLLTTCVVLLGMTSVIRTSLLTWLSAIKSRLGQHEPIVQSAPQAEGVMQLTDTLCYWSTRIPVDRADPFRLLLSSTGTVKLSPGALDCLGVGAVTIGTLLELLHRRDQLVLEHLLDTALPTPHRFSWEFQNESRPERWFLLCCNLEREQRELAVSGVVIDITERKLAEHKHRAAQQQAEAADHAKDQFLARLSHELRTPLTPVLAAVSAAIKDPTVGLDLGMIQRNIGLEAALINDLLDLSRILNGVLRLNLEPTEVHLLIRNAVKICQTEIEQAGLSCELKLEASQSWMMADSTRLHQVVWNLLKNSVKFTPPFGKITLSTSNLDGKLCVKVTDTGVGIKPEFLARVFNPFESDNHKRGGIGVGLSICKSVVEAHGGTIAVRSDGNTGSEFTVLLTNVIEAPTPLWALEDSDLGFHLNDQDAKILLVEDHADTLATFSRMLCRNYSVHTASSVESAIDVAVAQKCNLLISDLDLPDGSGLDLMRRLSQLQPTSGIAISGYGMEDDIKESLDAGFRLHLIKPVDADELEAAIAKVMRPADG